MTVLALALFVSALGESDARPRTLEQAGIVAQRAPVEDAVDAQDQAVLDRTLYGRLGAEELDEQQAEEMVAAARRMMDRRKERLERQRSLAEQGLVPRLSVTEYVLEFDRVRRVFDLAESRARLVHMLAETARIEVEAELAAPTGPLPVIEKFEGGRVFLSADLTAIGTAFEQEFGKPLPISARGDTRFHRALGFDHRGRVDVPLDPDQREGAWLRDVLRNRRIPYFAFRQAIPGKASARHIHIGPPSERLVRGN